MRSPEQTHAGFRSTRWSLVDGLAADDLAVRERAIGELADAYWPPVYAWFRRRGLKRDEAAERTQGFFTDVVLGRELLAQASHERGRLRTLVLSALQRYDIDLHRRREARKSSLHVPVEQIEREESLLAGRVAAEQGGPDEAFADRWDLAALENALREAEDHFVATGKAGHWRAFELRVLRPACGHPQAPLESVANECGFKSPALAAAAVQVVKKRLATLLACSDG